MPSEPAESAEPIDTAAPAERADSADDTKPPAHTLPPTPARNGRRTERTPLGPTGRAAVMAALLVVPVVPLAMGVGIPDRPDAPPQAVSGMPTAGVPVAAQAKVVPATGRPSRPVAAPSGLSVPSIGLNVGAPEQLGLDTGGRLAAPVDFNRIGWYAQGPKPGEAGPAVLVGHVDSFRGPAVFFRLADIKPGQKIVVPRTDGWRTTFTVDAVKHYPKDAFGSAEVYGATANAQLRLITCGGAFDRGARSYEDNVVVFASVH